MQSITRPILCAPNAPAAPNKRDHPQVQRFQEVGSTGLCGTRTGERPQPPTRAERLQKSPKGPPHAVKDRVARPETPLRRDFRAWSLIASLQRNPTTLLRSRSQASHTQLQPCPTQVSYTHLTLPTILRV